MRNRTQISKTKLDAMTNMLINMREIHDNIKISIGDRVEIIGNIPFSLKDKPRPITGRVTHVDGAYIYVKPKHQRYEAEFYACELRKIN